MTDALPILYSFRRCPYAMRARLALLYCQCRVELREIVLRDKPESLLAASPKGTVPVLLLPDQQVLEESLDIMLWALTQKQNDLLPEAHDAAIMALIHANDEEFKPLLDSYKYADRCPEPPEYYRHQAELYLLQLETLLQQHSFLLADEMTLADLAIMPFIRQFAHVDKGWFDQAPYPRLQQWLQQWLDSELFQAVMFKYEKWQPGNDVVLFPAVTESV